MELLLAKTSPRCCAVSMDDAVVRSEIVEASGGVEIETGAAYGD